MATCCWGQLGEMPWISTSSAALATHPPRPLFGLPWLLLGPYLYCTPQILQGWLWYKYCQAAICHSCHWQAPAWHKDELAMGFCGGRILSCFMTPWILPLLNSHLGSQCLQVHWGKLGQTSFVGDSIFLSCAMLDISWKARCSYSSEGEYKASWAC